ncbi:GNAT family N-acetyltransferase [Marinomonas sp. 15G1-11]|uniref:GNAT family N-acetyltransferase n=1 Tax=Marinomonas phaeophyticola TaxID=3004091 RepID=A0ABT4JWH1_9GAMM|nr:GNAT family N-acetyltransferase [Marinomonas sp. 15G1-11]MCZ2722725.1 GNAT family N-acetyltransferase [Marinomonas sp. 15G1-11]
MVLLKLEKLEPYLDDLVLLLTDAVENGASIGFLPPLSEEEARNYWLKVQEELLSYDRQVLAVRDEDRLVGTIQIETSPKADALHRCKVEKLIVLHDFQGNGFAKALIEGAERVAASMQKQLIFLETRTEDSASHLFTKMGYIAIGDIPNYARGAHGNLEATTFFYKEVEPTFETF